jgi:ABC-2 type transport system ATP-binding protein
MGLEERPLAVRTRGLRKEFDGKPALDGLDLEVRAGEFFGFLGPNGAGKTTTIHILTGVLEPTAGEAEVFGLPVPARANEVKSRIGVVPDESALFDRLTGGEFLEFAGRMYGLERATAAERARELMELFELDGRHDTLIANYSKGMKKRVSLGAALIHRPSLLLLDEPFEGVDPAGARLMKEILRRQTAAGATVFLTSHVLDVVERLCDRVAIVAHGRVVAQGALEELRDDGETLEDAFLRLVGVARGIERVSWLS